MDKRVEHSTRDLKGISEILNILMENQNSRKNY